MPLVRSSGVTAKAGQLTWGKGMLGRLVVVLAAIALVASGCAWDRSPTGAGSNNHSTMRRVGVNNVTSLHARWSASLANQTTGITQSDVGLIDITDGTTLMAVDPTTGATVWSRTEPSGMTVSAVTGYGNDILVATIESATHTANLEVRDARTGATVSTTPIAPTGGPTPLGLPGVSGITKSGAWVVTTWAGSMGRFTSPYVAGLGGFQVTNLDNPSLSWRYNGSIGAATYLDGYDSPFILGDRLYLEHTQGFYGGGSIESTATAWNLRCTSHCAPLFENLDITTAPIASPDGRALYAATAAGFAAFDPVTGAKQWEVPIDGNTFSRVFAATDDAEVVDAFVSTADGTQTVLGVYPKTCAATPCAPTWTTSYPVDTYVTNVVVANGAVYAAIDKYGPSGTATTTLIAYPLHCTDTCRPLSRTPVGEEVTAGPIVSNGEVLYGTASGKVAALTR